MGNNNCDGCQMRPFKLRNDKLNTTNWMHSIPPSSVTPKIVEVKFKNNRKEIYRNVNNLRLKQGDIVAVESNPGHDIGLVSLHGDIMLEQMKKYSNHQSDKEIKKIYRIAQKRDIDKWKNAIKLETPTLIKSRKIIEDLGLNMKLSDVEYQGDQLKAYFYYIADERVDFRELIKILAQEFHLRIEMRQIGARQEAALTGGIGVCGRKLCCAAWLNNFVSISTNAAREQEILINPEKLIGQCTKLKCCLNYELDTYRDAKKNLPQKHIALETSEGKLIHQKTDIFQGIMWYAYPDKPLNLMPISTAFVKRIIELNKKGIKVDLSSKGIKLKETDLIVEREVDIEENLVLKTHKSEKRRNPRYKKKEIF